MPELEPELFLILQSSQREAFSHSWPREILQLTLEICMERFINTLSKVAVLFPWHPFHILTVLCIASLMSHVVPATASHANRSAGEVLASVTDFKSQVLPNQKWWLEDYHLPNFWLIGSCKEIQDTAHCLTFFEFWVSTLSSQQANLTGERWNKGSDKLRTQEPPQRTDLPHF